MGRLDWKLILLVIGMLGTMGASWMNLNMRVVEIQTGYREEMKGYGNVLVSLRDQREEILKSMKEMEDRLGKRIDRVEDRINRR